MPRYTESEAREAVRSSYSYAEALRKLGLRAAGGNHALFRRYVDEVWRIPTTHFDPSRGNRERTRGTAVAIELVLVEDCRYNRRQLKQRLFDEGLKQRRCEMCGQGELWCDRPMSLILDHINGVATDNRLVNLRILCPNCNATLDTHCGRNNREQPQPRLCLRCGVQFLPRTRSQRYCSRACGTRHPRSRAPHPTRRKVPRPSYEQLVSELRSSSFTAVARRYGVSDGAVRKWVRWYRAQRDLAAGGQADLSCAADLRLNGERPAEREE
jgi:hypothetical protein